jgi:uncharacterized protein (DUF305 family)
MSLHARKSVRAKRPLALFGFLLALGMQALGGCSDSDDDNAATGGVGGSAHSGKGGGGAATVGHGGAAGQAGDGGAPGEDDGDSPVGDRRIPYTPADDAAFVAFFTEHHQMALDMALLEKTSGSAKEVKDLAAHMFETQTVELALLEVAKDTLGSAMPAAPSDPHAEADMAKMRSLTGVELDVMFLIDMIAHHAAGLAPAHRAHDKIQRADLKQLAADIFHAQAEEIGKMKEILTSLGNHEAGQDWADADADRVDFGLVGDRRIPLTPVDLTFIDFFVPHHQMAIEMAELAIDKGGDEVKQMATTMRASQQQEVETMLTVRLAIAGSAAVPKPPKDALMMAEMAHMRELSGDEFDRMFLTEMIPHHAAGLPPAHRAKPHLESPELQQMSMDIFDAQAREVGEMEEMLKDD